MGISHSKKNKENNYAQIIYPFVCDYQLKDHYNYNREEYFKFVPNKKIDIMKNDNCKIIICINHIVIEEIITLDVSKYTEKTDKDGTFYELEINRDKVTILFRVSSRGLKLKETVIKFFS